MRTLEHRQSSFDETIMAFRSKFGRKPTVCIGHPYLGRGGSESKVLWGIQALRNDCEITLVTSGGVDLGALNAFYGTSLKSSDFVLDCVPMPKFLQRRAAALRGAIYCRYFRKIAPQFDVLISGYNLCDLGCHGIQFIADFSWHEETRQRLHPTPPGFGRVIHNAGLLRWGYLALCRLVAPQSVQSVLRRDAILANSSWTAKQLKGMNAVDVSIVYPPVITYGREVAWEAKTPNFVCLGRVASEKRIEEIVDVLSAVRQRGHNLRLHIIGGLGNDAYARMIKRLCMENGEWVRLEGAVFGNEKNELLKRFRYGIHACQGEAFGIAIAEMVAAGCIPFVPAEGGPAEIVANRHLIFSNRPEAVEKIDSLLRKPALQAELRKHLQQRTSQFSAELLMNQVRRKVGLFLAAN